MEALTEDVVVRRDMFVITRFMCCLLLVLMKKRDCCVLRFAWGINIWSEIFYEQRCIVFFFFMKDNCFHVIMDDKCCLKNDKFHLGTVGSDACKRILSRSIRLGNKNK